MNDLEVLVNRKIKKYEEDIYFTNEQKERRINKIKVFLAENKDTFDSDLNEIIRLNEDIDSFTKYKRKLENKYERFINLDELYRMKLKRDDKVLYDILETFNKIQSYFFTIKMNDTSYKKYNDLLINLYILKQKYENKKESTPNIKKELDLINEKLEKLKK